MGFLEYILELEFKAEQEKERLRKLQEQEQKERDENARSNHPVTLQSTQLGFFARLFRSTPPSAIAVDNRAHRVAPRGAISLPANRKIAFVKHQRKSCIQIFHPGNQQYELQEIGLDVDHFFPMLLPNSRIAASSGGKIYIWNVSNHDAITHEATITSTLNQISTLYMDDKFLTFQSPGDVRNNVVRKISYLELLAEHQKKCMPRLPDPVAELVLAFEELPRQFTLVEPKAKDEKPNQSLRR